MSSHQYPTAEFVSQCFRYEKGKLFWKKRPLSHFSSPKRADFMNKRYAGTEAGTFNRHLNRWSIRLLGRKKYYRYHIVWVLFHGSWPKEIDHINRNRLDDRIENLRTANRSENLLNRALTKANTSGYKGIWQGSSGRWNANFKMHGVKHNFGWYDTAEEAHRAYVKGAKEICGDFLCTG